MRAMKEIDWEPLECFPGKLHVGWGFREVFLRRFELIAKI